MQVSTTLKVMIDAARKAGRVIARDFGEVENLQVSQKGPGDFVTASDLRVEKILIEELKKAKPDYAFLTEESGEIIENQNWEHRWIIDPIDGTHNFMHGIPYFAISIGLEKRLPAGKSEIIAGLVYAPISDEMFVAEKSFGAYLNNRRILVSSRKMLKDALLSTGFFALADKLNYNAIDLIKEITPLSSGVRCAGSAALDLAYVAAGRYDAFWHSGLKSWDIAAGILLVQEAKGMVTEIGTNKGALNSGNLLASNGKFDDKILQIIQKHIK